MNSFPDPEEDRGVRAVSPVIAHVLMAAAVIAIGITVLFWARNTFGAHQSEAGIFFSRSGEAMKESFVIEDVWFYEGSIDVTVRNVGTVGLGIAAICVNDDKIWDKTRWIEVGEAVTITVSFPWVPGEYYIAVATARGNRIRECYSTSG